MRSTVLTTNFRFEKWTRALPEEVTAAAVIDRLIHHLHDKDKQLIDFGKRKTMEIMSAAGARKIVQEARNAHLVGAARIGADPASSVIDGFGWTHEIANLLVCEQYADRLSPRVLPTI